MRIIVALLSGVLIAFTSPLLAQQSVKGYVRDKQSDEPIPFASVYFKQKSRGILTDSTGYFTLFVTEWPAGDTLTISSVGYKNIEIPFSSIIDTNSLNIQLEVLPPKAEAIVKAKYNRALWFWKRIMKFKDKHDKQNLDNYAYEVYNKLELDINNINKDKLSKNKLIKPLNFVFNYIDSTSEEKPFLPVYLTETLSDFYFQKSPYRTREVIKATKTNGLDNESIIKQLGGTYQNINIYNNFIPVFDKQFISPFHDNADNYYNFKLLDTQYLSKKRLVHLRFLPKRKGENTFEGDCWVHDTDYAVQKITLRPSGEANINFIKGLSLIQEYKLISDSTWFLYKDKFVADITPLGKSTIGFKGRKTTTYDHVQINQPDILNEIKKNKLAEEVVLLPDTEHQTDSFWLNRRHESLSKTETAVYQLLDTLVKNKTYNTYRNTLNFATTGTKDIGNVRIGPWYYWISGNNWEGTRVRFDLATNYGFSKKVYLNGYLAYGFTDKAIKGKAEVKYMFSRQPWSYVLASYRNDMDNGQVYYDQIGTDNIFALAFRKANIPIKFQKIEETKVEYYTETNKGFAFGVTLSKKQFNPLQNLPSKALFEDGSGNALNNLETSVKLRYAYLERFIEENFMRASLGSDYPIIELRLSKGWKNVLKSNYNYHRIDIAVSDYVKLAPYGNLYYNFFGGKIFGTLPYQLLEIHPGNELHYYNRYAFNLMNRFEYVSDKYAGFNIEHNIGNGLFRLTPLTRKLKFRQFWNIKGVAGDLSTNNRNFNFVDKHPFQSLDGKLYTEIGTGVDNILKFFRIDFVWRLSPRPLPTQSSKRFGIFGGFKVSF